MKNLYLYLLVAVLGFGCNTDNKKQIIIETTCDKSYGIFNKSDSLPKEVKISFEKNEKDNFGMQEDSITLNDKDVFKLYKHISRWFTKGMSLGEVKVCKNTFKILESNGLLDPYIYEKPCGCGNIKIKAPKEIQESIKNQLSSTINVKELKNMLKHKSIKLNDDELVHFFELHKSNIKNTYEAIIKLKELKYQLGIYNQKDFFSNKDLMQLLIDNNYKLSVVDLIYGSDDKNKNISNGDDKIDKNNDNKIQIIKQDENSKQVTSIINLDDDKKIEGIKIDQVVNSIDDYTISNINQYGVGGDAACSSIIISTIKYYLNKGFYDGKNVTLHDDIEKMNMVIRSGGTLFEEMKRKHHLELGIAPFVDHILKHVFNMDEIFTFQNDGSLKSEFSNQQIKTVSHVYNLQEFISKKPYTPEVDDKKNIFNFFREDIYKMFKKIKNERKIGYVIMGTETFLIISLGNGEFDMFDSHGKSDEFTNKKNNSGAFIKRFSLETLLKHLEKYFDGFIHLKIAKQDAPRQKYRDIIDEMANENIANQSIYFKIRWFEEIEKGSLQT